MRPLIVDIADLKVSDEPDVTLITYALGSCIAVAVHDPVRRAAGMIHYMLPLSTASPDRAAERPAMFGDIGVPMLFESMYRLGCHKPNLVVVVAGGAHIQDAAGVFNIGKRNYTVLRKMFWKNNVMIAAEHVGGEDSRTVSIEVTSGRTVLKIAGVETVLSSGTPRLTSRFDEAQRGDP